MGTKLTKFDPWWRKRPVPRKLTSPKATVSDCKLAESDILKILVDLRVEICWYTCIGMF